MVAAQRLGVITYTSHSIVKVNDSRGVNEVQYVRVVAALDVCVHDLVSAIVSKCPGKWQSHKRSRSFE